MLYSSYSYSSWDGTQIIFDMDAEELMDRLSSELLAHGDLWQALRDLMRHGTRDRDGQQIPGLNDLMEQLRNQRRQQLQQYDMDSVMEDIKNRLDEILKAEREGIGRRLEEARHEMEDAEGPDRVQMEALTPLLEQRAQRNLEKLDNLPQSTGGAIKELMDYDFMDPEAQRMFQELLDMLRSQMAQNVSQDMMQRLQNMTPGDMAAAREMLRQLNQMLRDKAMGREPDFDSFIKQFGPMFGPNPPANLEELMEQLMQQMAQMQSLMESMSPEARQELEDALRSAIDPETLGEMEELASLLEHLMPMDELRRQYPFLGDESLTLDQAMQLMGQLQWMDELENALAEAIRTGNLSEIDPDRLAEQLGEEARRTWEQLQRLLEALKEAGYIKEDSDGPELTPRAIRRIGQKALNEVFINLKKDRMGNHEMDTRGGGGDTLADTKPYEFGDPFQLDLHTTVKNAIVRAGPQVPVKLTHQRLRDISQRAHDQGRYGCSPRPEPVHGPVREFPSSEKGGNSTLRPYPQPIPQGQPVRHRILRLRTGDQGRGPAQDQLERLGLRHQHASCPDAFPQAAFQGKGRDSPDYPHNRRRAHRPPGGRQVRLQLSPQLQDHHGDPQRGQALHPGRYRHQHLHART